LEISCAGMNLLKLLNEAGIKVHEHSHFRRLTIDFFIFQNGRGLFKQYRWIESGSHFFYVRIALSYGPITVHLCHCVSQCV